MLYNLTYNSMHISLSIYIVKYGTPGQDEMTAIWWQHFKCIFLYGDFRTFIHTALICVPKGAIDSKITLMKAIVIL